MIRIQFMTSGDGHVDLSDMEWTDMQTLRRNTDYWLRSSQTEAFTLAGRGYRFGDRELHEVMWSLRRYAKETLRRISFNRNNITALGAQYLSTACLSFTALQSIRLAHNPLGDEGAIVIASVRWLASS